MSTSTINENIIVPAYSEVSKEVIVTPAKNVYSSEKSSIEIKTNVVSPYCIRFTKKMTIVTF